MGGRGRFPARSRCIGTGSDNHIRKTDSRRLGDESVSTTSIFDIDFDFDNLPFY